MSAIQRGARYPDSGAKREELCVVVDAVDDESPWMRRVRDLTEWRDLNPHRWPRNAALDDDERSLGVWLANQRSRRRLSPTQEEVLNARCPGWEGSRRPRLVASFSDNIEALLAWRNDSGLDWPSITASNQDERRLARWLTNFERRRNGPPQRSEILDRVVPGWEKQYSPVWHHTAQAWGSNLQDLVRWVRKSGTLPKARAENRIERRLGVWVENQRRGASLTPSRTLFLDTLVPDWSRLSTPTFEVTVAELIEWRAARGGRWPSTHSDDGHARRLGYWVEGRRRAAPSAKDDLLDTAVPGWRSSRADAWERNLRLSADWLHGHPDDWPVLTGATDAEQNVASWLASQRSGRGLTSLRESRLNEVVPGWRDPHFMRWNSWLIRVVSWRNEHPDRWPSAYSRDATEKSLARWCRRQGEEATAGRLSADRQRTLNQQLPMWNDRRIPQDTSL